MAIIKVITPSVTDANITLAKLGADSVNATKIADGSIENEHLNVLAVTGQTAETSIADGDTILIHDASASALRKMTKANFVSGIGGANTPAFSVYKNGSFNISDAAVTKIPFDTETFDTDNAFASNKFTIPSGKGGNYFFYTKAMFLKLGNSEFNIQIKKNGTKIAERYVYSGAVGTTIWTSSYFSFDLSTTVSLSAGDYMEVFVMANTVDGGAATINGGSLTNQFSGFKLI